VLRWKARRVRCNASWDGTTDGLRKQEVASLTFLPGKATDPPLGITPNIHKTHYPKFL